MSKKMLILMMALLSMGGIYVQHSFGIEYPTKTIEIFVGYTPGSTSDLTGRMIADVAPKYLGQPLVVVNKPGAGGSVAAAEVIKSKPDGYKLMITTNSFFALTTKTQKLTFDPKVLEPLASYVEIKSGIMVKGDSPWKTFNELLDYGRKTGQLRYGHAGRGMHNHIYGSLIFKKAGVEIIDVPYPGALDKLTALLGGHIDAAGEPYGTVREHLKAGKVRFLLFVNDQRYSLLPDVPCTTELGFSEASQLKTLWGAYIHKDTPQEIKKTLVDALQKTIEDPEFKKRIGNLGEEAKYVGPEASKETIAKAEELSVPKLKELGLYVGK